MTETILITLATLLIGWILGRLSSLVDVTYQRRAARNRLVFHLIELYEDIAKRRILDEWLLSRFGGEKELAKLRKEVRLAVPDEAIQSQQSLLETIRATSEYDPLFAHDVATTLMPAKLLDERLLTVPTDPDEFEVMLRLLAPLDQAMMKRLELLSVSLASRNSFGLKRRIRSFYTHREAGLRQTLESQRKLRDLLTRKPDVQSSSGASDRNG
jgi:hypothetical protein